MKKANLMSKLEMKKITGGVPSWSATCTEPFTGVKHCLSTIQACNLYCQNFFNGTSCEINYGYIGCGEA